MRLASALVEPVPARPRQLEFHHEVQRHAVGDDFRETGVQLEREVGGKHQAAVLRDAQARIGNLDVGGARRRSERERNAAHERD